MLFTHHLARYEGRRAAPRWGLKWEWWLARLLGRRPNKVGLARHFRAESRLFLYFGPVTTATFVLLLALCATTLVGLHVARPLPALLFLGFLSFSVALVLGLVAALVPNSIWPGGEPCGLPVFASLRLATLTALACLAVHLGAFGPTPYPMGFVDDMGFPGLFFNGPFLALVWVATYLLWWLVLSISLKNHVRREHRCWGTP
ncbi:MAG: hypothetical protein JST40_06005 [Armatimonadetes bacterium]|nr:hypothetical protein [Armatimonadota bacterium]